MQTHAIILAAGQGTRMRSALPKVLHPVAGQPMLGHVLDTTAAADIQHRHVVLGHAVDEVKRWLTENGCGDADVAVQQEQLGTAHAVRQALPQVPDDALVVVLYGDVPLVEVQILRDLCQTATSGLALVTARPASPFGYGRILRDAQGAVTGIVEEKDATVEQRAIGEVNSGLMAAPAAQLRDWIARVGNDNVKGEYYLTDVVALAVADGVRVATVEAADAASVEGVNDRRQLAAAERRCQRLQAEKLMAEGLQLADPERFDLRGELHFGRDVGIDVGCVLEGRVELGDGATIGPYTVLRNVRVAAGAHIASHCVLEQAEVGTGCTVGPYARLRPGAQLEADAHIGNFVEVKNSRLGPGAKAGHLAYIGDADIGARANISAGVITCNYDGANKHRTVVGDDAFVGTDTQLIAPLNVGKGAFIAAGSTIAQDVPAGGLTICRARGQKTLSNWQRPTKKK